MIITITMSMITTMIMMLQEHLCSLVVNARRHKAEVGSGKMHLRKQCHIHSSSYSFKIIIVFSFIFILCQDASGRNFTYPFDRHLMLDIHFQLKRTNLHFLWQV